MTVIGTGTWTWFNDPRAIVINGVTYVGGVSKANGIAPDGSIIIAGSDSSNFTLHSTFEADDHDNPGFLRRNSDGRIIAFYSRHNVDANYYMRVSTNPDDMSAWQAEVNIGSQLNSIVCSYANPVEIVGDGIFLFMRGQTGAMDYYTTHFSKSTDGGTTWAQAQQLTALEGQRQYFKVRKNPVIAGRIDIICNDGHPDEMPSSGANSSTFHFYYKAGHWFNSAGTDIGSPPFVPATSLTRIYDAAGFTNPGSWVNDLAFDSAGNPIAVYSTTNTPYTDLRYRYAKFNGTSWSEHAICTGGGCLYPSVNPGQQPSYNGGIVINPDNPNIIYCCRETGKFGTLHQGSGGVFQIWRGLTRDDGATWQMDQLTYGAIDYFRPFMIPGQNKILCCSSDAGAGCFYTGYTFFLNQIVAIDGGVLSNGAMQFRR